MRNESTERPVTTTESPAGLRLVEAHHRLALWAGAFCVVALVAAFGLSRSAEAAPAPAGNPFNSHPTALTVDEVFETEDGEASAAECAVEAQEEIAEGEPVETECDDGDEGDETEAGEAPEECFVRTAAATVSTSPDDDTVRVSIHYTSWTPSTVAVTYGLRGGKGGLALGHATKRFGKQGVLKLTANLSDAETLRAAAAKEFDVTVRAVNTPGYCGKIFAQRLDAHGAAGQARVWTD